MPLFKILIAALVSLSALSLAPKPAVAQQWIDNADKCEQGDKRACALALIYAQDNLKTGSIEMAYVMISACKGGITELCEAGVIQFAGMSLAENTRTDEIFAWQGCKQGVFKLCRPLDDIDNTDPEAMNLRQANACVQGGAVITCERSMEYYRQRNGLYNSITRDLSGQACIQGSAKGCALHGQVMEAVWDYDAAAEYLRKGCDGGVRDVCADAERMEARVAYQQREAEAAERAARGPAPPTFGDAIASWVRERSAAYDACTQRYGANGCYIYKKK